MDAYYCRCGELFLTFLGGYIHLFTCERYLPSSTREEPITTLTALSGMTARRFHIHPRTILQVCSSCFDYRTIDNWSMTSHWTWCVGEGAWQRERARQQNVAYLGGRRRQEAELTQRRVEILDEIEEARQGRAARISRSERCDDREGNQQQLRDELARDESILAAADEEKERVWQVNEALDLASPEASSSDWKGGVSSVEGEQGSEAMQNDVTSEIGGENHYSPDQAPYGPHPSAESAESSERGEHVSDESRQVEYSDNWAVEHALDDMREIEPEYELSGNDYESDPGLGTEWDSGADGKKEPHGGGSVERGVRWRDNENDLANWATAGRRGKRDRVTSSDTSLDSRLYSLCEGLETAQAREGAKETTFRARRAKRETRQRREQKALELSESESEVSGRTERTYRKRKRRTKTTAKKSS